MKLQFGFDTKEWKTQKKKKIDIYIFLSIMFKKKNEFFTSKGDSKDLCYSSEPVYSP